MVELWKHQQKAIDDNHPYRLFSIFAGGGKSLILTELVRRNAFSVLCLTPKSLKMKWERELADIGVEFTVLTPYWFKEYHKKLPHYDAVIIDEADSPWAGDNQSSKALLRYLKKHTPSYVWLATATPYRSTPKNVYMLGKICGYMPTLYQPFKEQFFYEDYFGWQPKLKHPDHAVREQCQRELHEYMRNFADIVEMEEVFDVPEIIYATEPIAMTDAQEKMLRKVDELSENRASFYTYANEIENGYIDEKAIGEFKELPSEKTERVLELASQNDTLVIFAKYKIQQRQLYEALKKKYPKAYVALLNGDNSNLATELSEELELIAQGKHPKYETGYLVASVAVAAGWEVKSCRMAVYASLPWSYQQWIQSKQRILRSNNLQKTVYKILQSGQVDERVWTALQLGEDYDPAKYKGT